MIDAHVHLFPTEEAGRNWQQVVGFEPIRAGTVDAYAELMAQAGVRGAVVLLFARAGRRYRDLRASDASRRNDAELRAEVLGEIQTLNRWGCELSGEDPRFVPFIGVDPTYMDADAIVSEIVRGVRAGARGVKIVPPDMERYPDDPALDIVYRTCVELGVPVLSQSGNGGSVEPGPRGPYGRPSGWHAALKRHQDLRVILAHLGRGYTEEVIELAERHGGVHTDLSLALGHPHDTSPPDSEAIRRTVRRIGVDRVLFGTNYPICDPVEYRHRFEALRLTAAERAAVGEDNILRLTAA